VNSNISHPIRIVVSMIRGFECFCFIRRSMISSPVIIWIMLQMSIDIMEFSIMFV